MSPTQTVRETTLETINRMLEVGDEKLGHEPVGVVLIYRDQAFLKAVWTKDSSREDIAQGLITAAADELSKA